MSMEQVEKIAKSVLYEGYMLYPYRPSSTKNRQHWSFGTLYPEGFGEVREGNERSGLQLECLIKAAAETTVRVGARFLHLIDRQVLAWDPEMERRPVASLSVDGQLYESWQEGAERSVDIVVDLSKATAEVQRTTFSFASSSTCEELRCATGEMAGALCRTQEAIQGVLEARAASVGENLYRLTLRLNNQCEIPAEMTERAAALLHAFLSAHLILQAQGGEFTSLIDPPVMLAKLAEECRNIGVYPVLVGEPGQHDLLLAAPIALYDYPQIAPESDGDFFDSTEIDELLTLRVMTMTDDEKREMSSADEHVRKILERAENTGREQMMRTHGVLREMKPVEDKATMTKQDFWQQNSTIDRVTIRGRDVRVGDRVILRPSKSADILDMALAGKTAVVEAIERDFEDNIHLAVVIEDDPGREFGMMRLPGHRFFFSTAEVEPTASSEEAA